MSLKVLTIANNKGGVGKTTLSQIISVALAKTGRRVLGIDLDPQCNYSRRFLSMEIDPDDPEIIRPPLNPDYDPAEDADWDGYASSADIFWTGESADYPTPFENLRIIPGHSKNLLAVERVTQQEVAGKVHRKLKDWLFEESGLDQEYDLVVIDTGPSKGPLTISALQASTHILIPGEMEEMSVEGLFGMLAFWRMNNLQRDASNPLNLIGVLANKFDNRLPLHEYYFDSLSKDQQMNQYLLPYRMHSWQAYKEMSMHDGKHVLDLAPSDKARQEAEQICNLIEDRLYG